MKVGDKRYSVRSFVSGPKLYCSTIVKVTEKMAYVARGDTDAFQHRQQLPLAEAEALTSGTPRGAWLKYGMELQAEIDKLEEKMAKARAQQEIARREADAILAATEHLTEPQQPPAATQHPPTK